MSDESWAWVENHGYDADGHERREQCQAIVECDTCGKDVELVADTESWVQAPDGRWSHESYGPAQGVCCQNLYVESFEGCFRYDLRHSHA